MRNEIEQNQAALNLFADDSAFTLTDAELLTIHGGTTSSGGGANSGGSGDGGGYGATEFRQDLSTVGSAASLGNMVAPGGPGAAAGAGFGMGIVAEQRFQVVENVVDAAHYVADVARDFANNVIQNEETHRSNII